MAAVRRAQARSRRRQRVRKKIRGSAEKPRLTVFRSAKHIYAQLIDDGSACTILESSSLSKDMRASLGSSGGNKKGAAVIGKSIAEKALGKRIKKVVFDRNGFLYHGRVKALADAAREAGLTF